jgi:hypothetical protein
MNSHCNNRQCRGLSLDDSEGDSLSFLYRDFLDSITDVFPPNWFPMQVVGCGAMIPSSSFDTSEEIVF